MDLVRQFINKQGGLPIKDITQIKTIHDMKKNLTRGSKYQDGVKDKNINILLNGEEWFVFIAKNIEGGKTWGDSAWCINRQPTHFFDEDYGALYGGVIQCINKIDYKKNMAIQIDIDSDKVVWKQDVKIWDQEDNDVYDGILNDLESYENVSPELKDLFKETKVDYRDYPGENDAPSSMIMYDQYTVYEALKVAEYAYKPSGGESNAYFKMFRQFYYDEGAMLKEFIDGLDKEKWFPNLVHNSILDLRKVGAFDHGTNFFKYFMEKYKHFINLRYEAMNDVHWEEYIHEVLDLESKIEHYIWFLNNIWNA